MTKYVDIQYIRNALGITGTKQSCKGCKYNEPIGFACNTYKAPSFAYVCEVLDDAPIVDAVPIEFIRSGIKNTQGAYPYSLRILLDTWERENSYD